MIRMLRLLFLASMATMLAACGNQGQSGNGNTVYIDSATTKATTPGAVFANISGVSSASYTANSMAYTLSAKPYATSTKITPSKIEIRNVTFAYSPVTTTNCVPPAFNPVNENIKTLHVLSAPGTTDIENIPILYPSDMAQIYANATAGERICQYDVTLTFSGVEVDTGVSVSKPVTTSAYVKIKK